MRIAVVGGGISGLSAAWLLAPQHTVTLFEKEDWIGGHAHSVDIETPDGKIAVDTGFIILNPYHYPNLLALFKELGVETREANMRFSVSMCDGGFEWASDVPTGVFVDWRNAVRPSYWKFLLEVARFNRCARKALNEGIPPTETLEQFLDRYHISEDARTKFVYPMAGAIWSTPILGAKRSPAQSIFAFLNNHGLLNIPPGKNFLWHTVIGTSRSYIDKIRSVLLEKDVVIKSNTPVIKVMRNGLGAVVITESGEEQFDLLVMATHADTTLRLLADAGDLEQQLLSEFVYERNEVVLHRDAVCMPHRKKAWASWNYLGETRGADGEERVSLTYHINDIQGLDSEIEIFVTLNPNHPINPALIYATYNYEHPIYTPRAIGAQKKLSSIQNVNKTLFCGSYFGSGFHEDGITSAIEAVAVLRIKPPWKDPV